MRDVPDVRFTVRNTSPPSLHARPQRRRAQARSAARRQSPMEKRYAFDAKSSGLLVLRRHGRPALPFPSYSAARSIQSLSRQGGARSRSVARLLLAQAEPRNRRGAPPPRLADHPLPAAQASARPRGQSHPMTFRCSASMHVAVRGVGARRQGTAGAVKPRSAEPASRKRVDAATKATATLWLAII